MPQWMKDLFAGWPMIRANLPTFFIVLVLMIGVVWAVVNWSYSVVLASKNGQIELQDRQLADYREKLKGATPEQAKDKIDALEQTIKAMIGNKWSPLTSAQVSAVALKLKDIPKSRAHIMHENYLGKDLAQSIFDAFKQAGWDQLQFGAGSGLGEGIVVGWSTRAANVGAALETAGNLKGVWAKDTGKEIPDLVIVGVGLNVRQ